MFFVLGFFTQCLFALPAHGAVKQGLWAVKAATAGATLHSADIPIFSAIFCLHICGAHLALQELGNALCEAERRNPGAF